MGLFGFGGEKVGDAYIEIHARGDNVDDDLDKIFDEKPGKTEDRGRKSAKRFKKGVTEELDKGFDDNKDHSLFGDTARNDKQNLDNLIYDIGRLRKVTNEETKDGRLNAAERKHGQERIRKYREELDHLVGTLGRDFEVAGKRAGHVLDDLERSFQSNGDRNDGFVRKIERSSLTLGKVFGKGSRNNFLNFFGSIVGGVTGLVPKLIQFGSVAKDAIGGVITTFTEAQGAGAKVGVLVKGLSSLALGFVAVGVAALVLAAILGPIVAGFSLLLGIVIALAASLTFALAGALGAILGIALPLVGAIGVLVLAFTGLSDAAKNKLGASLAGIKTELGALRAVAQKGLFQNIPQQTALFAQGVKALTPLVKALSVGVSDFATILLKGFASKGFDDFSQKVSRFLPDALKSLGAITRDTFGGVGGIFVSLIPLTQRFLTFLERVTGDFSAFTNSAKGQEQLQSFFKRAGDSARDFGTFLGSVVRLVAKLFSFGKSTGDDIFTSSAKNIDKFTKSLTKVKLDKYFADVKKFAKAIGNLIVDIGKFADSLDDAQSRGNITGFVNGVADAFKVLSSIFSTLNVALSLAPSLIKVLVQLLTGDFRGALETTLRFTGKLFTAIGKGASLIGLKSIGNKLQELGGNLQETGKHADELNNKKVAPKVDATSLHDALKASVDTENAIRSLSGLPPISLEVRTAEAKLEVQVLEALLVNLGRTLAGTSPEVVLDTANAKFQLGALEASYANLKTSLAGALPEARLKVDASQAILARIEFETLQNKYRETLGIPEVKIKVSAREAEILSDKLDIDINKLGLLDGTTASPDVNSPSLDLFEGNVNDASNALSDLSRKNAKPKVTYPTFGTFYSLIDGKLIPSLVDLSGKKPKPKVTYPTFSTFFSALGNIISRLAAIKDKNVTIHTNFTSSGKNYTASHNPHQGGSALGGLIKGPGTGTSDSIPTFLSNGEFVVRAAVTARNLALLQALNSGVPYRGNVDRNTSVTRFQPGAGSGGGGSSVSGNSTSVGDIYITTPTGDPRAVAKETINEIVNRGF